MAKYTFLYNKHTNVVVLWYYFIEIYSKDIEISDSPLRKLCYKRMLNSVSLDSLYLLLHKDNFHLIFVGFMTTAESFIILHWHIFPHYIVCFCKKLGRKFQIPFSSWLSYSSFLLNKCASFSSYIISRRIIAFHICSKVS